MVDWVEYLLKEKLWGLDDPLFPATKIVQDSNRQFVAGGIERKHWSSAAPIRAVFKEAFERAGLPYFNPHSFRKTLVRFGLQRCLAEAFKAWSQNLGHEHMLTTLTSYGTVPRYRQGEIMRELREPRKQQD